MSWTAASNRQFESAAALLHAAQSVWKGIGTTVSAFGPLETDFKQTVGQIRRELGEARFRSILDGGPALSKDQAVELALNLAKSSYVSPRADSVDSGHSAAVRRTNKAEFVGLYSPGGPQLTERETQVAALVAQGRSNKEIAAELVLSPRTVSGHIERILSKLGFTSRTQVASWLAGRTTAQ